MGILSGNPKNEPMHYGEVFGLWSYLLGLKGMLTTYQTLFNHAGDATKAQFGARILRMNKEKGWLVVPPLHMQAPEPVHA